MPTPVATARQCLTDEAARALDEAVSVAKRRNHAQTTSLHAISALLSPTFSLLRDSLSRIRSSAYSPRLQLRALELCVGVSLDRLPSSKSPPPSSSTSQGNDEFAPPISNSLMAAIKRSQAHQRRQPDMYHLNQIHHNINNANSSNGPLSISCIKVELKHFVLSILDDPIVSRVFGEAGFRSSDIKLAIIHPPRWAPSTTTTTARCPPLFLCNFMDFAAASGGVSANFGGGGGGDGNSKRIGEVMVKNRERNPVLVGVCAKDALAKFKENIVNQKYSELPAELTGLRLVCLEKEIRERENEGLDLKIEEVRSTVENEDGVKIVVNLGEFKVFVNDDNHNDEINVNDEITVNNQDYGKEVVVKVGKLVEVCEKKVWLIGEAANYETYSKFLGRFPSVEKDWDLQPLPITAASSSSSSFDPKSSLMGSFVPFGGFFPTPSDFRAPLSAVRQPFTRCNSCNESYERELRAVLREGLSVSIADDQSSNLPSWLQRAESDPNKAGNVAAQVKDVRNEKISCLQKKWDDHCRLGHQNYPFAAPAVSLASLQVAQPMGFRYMADLQGSRSTSGDSSLNEKACSNSSSGVQIVAQNISPQKQVMKPDIPKRVISECHLSPRESSASQTYPISSSSLASAQKQLSTVSAVSVTTDLGLGTIYASKCQEQKKPFFQNRHGHLNPFPGSLPSSHGIHSKESMQIICPSGPFAPSIIEGVDLGDYKPLFRKLSEAVSWQDEAIRRIAQIVSRSKSGDGRQHATDARGNIWLSFHGPDKIGKKRVAQALADAVHGSRDRLIALNLSCQDKTMVPDSLFLCQGLSEFDITASRITAVDHIAQQLCRKPQSVVFLENIDDADPLVQNSLSHALQTGKFPDSRGKEVGINNVVFVTTSSVTKDEQNLSPRKEFVKFLEDKIMEAKNWQMQIAIRTVSGDACRSNETTVSLLAPKRSSDKRKLSYGSDRSEDSKETKRANKMPKKSLDLNLPLEDEEEVVAIDSHEDSPISDGSKAWLEDFFGQVDGNVAFKPFDFDALADNLLRKIRLKLEETLRGQRILLEIDHEVMLQILAAAWNADKKGAVDDWIGQVLGMNLSEAWERYHLTAESVVRLCSCEGAPVNDMASGICLPSRINLSI